MSTCEGRGWCECEQPNDEPNDHPNTGPGFWHWCSKRGWVWVTR